MTIRRAPSITSTTVETTRVSKRLSPGQNGSKRFLAEYGDTLVCVRYRQDSRKRYTTVEIIVDQRDLPPPGTRLEDFVTISIDYREKDLRARAKTEGARWDADRRRWIMSRAAARKLGLEGRIEPQQDGQ